MADKDAERFRRTTASSLAPTDVPPEFPTTSAYAIVNDVIVTKDLRALLQNSHDSSDLRCYIKRTTLAKQHLFNKVRLVKFMHNWLHVGRWKNLINQTDLGNCPVCSKSHKTWQYLFHCQHPDSLAIRSLALISFNTAM
eukprot:13827728-Ditylum_brightwellii.AAC.1